MNCKEAKFIKIDILTLPYPPFAWPTFTTTGNFGVISCNKKEKQETFNTLCEASKIQNDGVSVLLTILLQF